MSRKLYFMVLPIPLSLIDVAKVVIISELTKHFWLKIVNESLINLNVKNV